MPKLLFFIFFYVKTALEKAKKHVILSFCNFSSLPPSFFPPSSWLINDSTVWGELESARQIWQRVLGELQIQVSKANYATWLKNSQGVSCQQDAFVVWVPTTFVAEWLTKRLHSLIRKTLAEIIGRDIEVEFTVHDQDEIQGDSVRANQTDGGTSTRVKTARFNPKYTFDSFIVGDCNRLAYAAALEIAENPAHAYNPFVIFGGTGQGKTHLLHAIGHKATRNGLRATYISADRFTNEFVLAVKQRRVEEFRNQFNSIQILLFDDIHFIASRKQTQQCFFHIFNELYNSNCQIAVTGDCSPEDMTLLSNKLKSRLECGLITSIEPPEFETRLSILQAKAKETKTSISNEVLQLLTERITGNVRQLEGALIYLTAQAKLTGQELTPQTVDRLLTGITSKQGRKMVIEAVADYFDLSIEELVGRRRDRKTALARRTAIYLMRGERDCSFAAIGKELGNRSHIAIAYAHKKMVNEMEANPKLKEQTMEIRKILDLGATRKAERLLT
jgi:chromosomal replication initiator protein